MLVYSPLENRMGLGSIAVEFPLPKPMTPAEYRAHLAARIQDMVNDLPTQTQRKLLFEVEFQEQFPVLDHLNRAGEAIVENSSALRMKVAMPVEPIPPQLFKPDPETVSALKEDNLEEYLSLLYR